MKLLPINENIKQWLNANYLWLASIVIIFAFSINELYRHLILIFSIIGLYQLARTPSECINDKSIRFMVFLFLCIWVPMVIATIDAEYLKPSLSATLRYVAYPLAGIAILRLSRVMDMQTQLLFGVFAVMFFWVVDAMFQLLTGADFFGYPAVGNRLTGMFYPSVRLSNVLAMLSPIYFEAVRRLAIKSNWSWLLVLPLLIVVIFGGGRLAWLFFGMAIIAYLIYWFSIQRDLKLKWVVPSIVIAIFLVVAGSMQTSWLQQRVEQTFDIFSGDYETVNAATSFRLPIWKTAWNMFTENPVTGTGPKTFRHLYPKYMSDPDERLAGQPHLFVLEIAAATGLVGLAGYLIFLVVLVRKILALFGSGQQELVPWGFAVLLAVFPLSSTLPFYAHYMSAFIWMLIILFIRQLEPYPKTQ